MFSREFILKQFIPWVTKGGLAIVDFGLFSGSNFVLGILLARWMAPEQYGAYALSFTIFILIGFLFQALLLEPLSVFAGTTFRNNIRGYMQSTIWIHWVISFVVCFILLMIVVAGRIVGHSMVFPAALAGMTIAAPFIMIHALVRRGFYLIMSPGPAAFGTSFYCVLVMAGVFFVYRHGWLSAFTAFLVMGFSALASAGVIFVQLNRALDPATGHPALRDTWSKHWEYGKWALATCVVGWVPNYIYIPVVSSFSGLAAAAQLRALMNLAGPVLQTFAALSMLFLPYAARVQDEGGRPAAAALNRKLTLIFIAGALAYWAAIIPLRHYVFQVLYGGKYMEVSYLVPLFALETIIWSAALGPAILLRGMESPRSLFIANGYASAIAFLFGFPATYFFGLKGVVWSMISANLLYAIVAYVLYIRRAATLKTLQTVNLSDPVQVS